MRLIGLLTGVILVSKNALITGEAGFVRRRLINFLNMKNYNVRIISRNISSDHENIV